MARKLALIIGNSEYEDKNLAALVTPGSDVKALAQILRDPEIGGFDEVTALVNQPVAAIRRAIAGFYLDKGREDLLLLYFSGHGMRDDRGGLYLAVRDTEHKLLRGTAIPASFITEEMDNSRSRRQVLILDCCHSGAFSRGMKGVTGVSVGTAAAFEGTGAGRVVLTASDSTQYAWEGDQITGQAESSVFTRYLIQGLRTGEADVDADGQITLDELYDYVHDRVVNETPKQTPSKWSYGQQGEIVLAQNLHPVVKPADLPPDLQQTIDDPRPWVRESSLRELDRLIRGTHRGLAAAAREALQKLTEDDSRRVAGTAAEFLAAYPGDQNPAVKAREIPAADTMAAREHAGMDIPLPLKTRHDASRESGDRVTESRSTDHPPPARRTDRRWLPPEQLLNAAINNIYAKPIWAIAIGSAIGGWLGAYIGWSYDRLPGVITGGIILGISMGLVLGRKRWSTTGMIMLLMSSAFVLSDLLSKTINDSVADAVSAIFGSLIDKEIVWNTGWWIGTWIAGALGSTIGGVAAGLMLRAMTPSIRWKQVWIIALGWSASFGFGWVASMASGDATGWEKMWPYVIGTSAGSLVSGIAGSSIIFSQLKRSSDPADH